MMDLKKFYKDKRVLITGHTGFKGTWLAFFMVELGSQVIGYSLDPNDSNSLYNKSGLSLMIKDFRGNILDIDYLDKVVIESKPEIVFHLAAQPLVNESYNDPLGTWTTNVIGTANLMEVLRKSKSVKSIVIVTTDKVYMNLDSIDAYMETDKLGGYDPYSASKAACEMLVESYRNSFYDVKKIGIASARSGNVIGGGDWSENRLIPDFFRSYFNKSDFIIRNPDSIRPWQHVLDVSYGYILLALKLYMHPEEYSSSFNFGPSHIQVQSVEDLINKILVSQSIPQVKVNVAKSKLFHETNVLKLNSEKANALLNWKNKLSIEESIDLTVKFYMNYFNGNIKEIILFQIHNYLFK